MKKKSKQMRVALKVNPQEKRKCGFRFREEVIEALKNLTVEFNTIHRTTLSKTAMLELLIINELNTLKKKLNSLGSKDNLTEE